MKIWIIDHYSVPPKYYPLARNSIFAKYLTRMGHDVKIIAASTVHNSNINLINGNHKYKEIIEDGISYILIRCSNYHGNGIKRVLNTLEFSNKLEEVCENFQKPDVIISQSMTLNACASGIKLAKKFNCKSVAQITDLWPETLVEYRKMNKYNPLIIYLRQLEKWIYINANKIIFSMEGAYDYIIEQNWQDIIPKTKIAYINNGVDLETYDINKDNFIVNDDDLTDKDSFNVIYVGSIRRVNSVGVLLDSAKLIKNRKIKILIWGKGDELEFLKQRVIDENISNVVFKGFIDKKYIPSILSNASLCIAHNDETPLLRFGISLNKMFDYLASGHPVLFDFNHKYNPAVIGGAGIKLDVQTPENIANTIDYFSNLSKDKYSEYCKNAIAVAKQYDFKVLTNKLVDVINSI